MKPKIRSARRVVDMPDWYGGGYDLATGMISSDTQYTKSSWAYACMNIRGTELAGLPWHITKNGKIVKKHVIIDLLTQFGPESNYAEAVQSTEIDMLRIGAAFWFRDVDILKRLNPGTIKVLKNRAGITGFQQTISGKVVNTFKREEIVYFKEYNPGDDLGVGVPVMDVIKNAIDTEYEALQYVEAHFKNDAVPGLLLTTEQIVPETEMNRIIQWWNARFRGTRNKGKVGIADRGLKAEKITDSIKDNAVVEIRDQARNDICVGMRVPKILVGSMTESTYANAKEARKYLIEDTIIPRAKYYADTINQDLVRHIDPNVKFEFALDELNILQEDTDSKWARLSEGMELGLISPEFVRTEMGYPEESAADKQPLRSWQKKALNALKRGESPDVAFETDIITVDKQIQLHARLAQASTVKDVKRAFSA